MSGRHPHRESPPPPHTLQLPNSANLPTLLAIRPSISLLPPFPLTSSGSGSKLGSGRITSYPQAAAPAEVLPGHPKLVASLPEDAVLSVLGVSVKDNMHQRPSSCDSFSSMDNLQHPPSSSLGATSLMGTEGSDSNVNNNDEICSIRNSPAGNENHLTSSWNRRAAPALVHSSLINNTALHIFKGGNASDKSDKKKKGLLASIHTSTANLFVVCASLFGFSYAYSLAPKARMTFGNTWMKVITTGSLIALYSSWTLSCLASYFKESESIDGAGFQIFTWLLLTVLLFLNAVICITLRFCANISNSVILPLGITGSCLILFGWFWVFYVEWPKILEDVKEGNVGENEMLSQRPDSEPTLATGLDRGCLKKWAKAVCEKMGSCLRLRGPTQPAWATGVDGANLSSVWGICAIEVK